MHGIRKRRFERNMLMLERVMSKSKSGFETNRISELTCTMDC